MQAPRKIWSYSAAVPGTGGDVFPNSVFIRATYHAIMIKQVKHLVHLKVDLRILFKFQVNVSDICWKDLARDIKQVLLLVCDFRLSTKLFVIKLLQDFGALFLPDKDDKHNARLISTNINK